MPETHYLIPCKKCSTKSGRDVFHEAPACAFDYEVKLEGIDGYTKSQWVEWVSRISRFIKLLKQMDQENAEKEK